jgi:hypothetical protein
LKVCHFGLKRKKRRRREMSDGRPFIEEVSESR